MTTRSIHSILASLKKAHTQAQTDVNDLAAKFKGKSRDTIRQAILPELPKLYKVRIIDGSGKAEGTRVIDSTSKDYESARKFLGRILSAIAPTEAKTSGQRIDVPRALRNSIVDQIIAAGLEKKQFDALLAQLRDAVAFK